MHYITSSRTAMTLAVLGAALYATGVLMAVIAFATLDVSNAGTFTALEHAHDWLLFSGSLLALIGVAAAGWELFVAKRNGEAVEVGVAGVATLLVVIASLVAAASTSSDQAADVLGAIGVGGWGFLCLSRAARRSLAEQQEGLVTGATRQSAIWLGAAVGLVIFAVGSGLVVSPDNQGVSIAAGVISAVGLAVLAGALAVARNERLLMTPPTAVVIGGLAVLTVAFVTNAIVAGVVFGSSFTVTGLRVGVSIAETILMVGIGALGWAAWARVGELTTSGMGNLWRPTTLSTAAGSSPGTAGGGAPVPPTAAPAPPTGSPGSPGAQGDPGMGATGQNPEAANPAGPGDGSPAGTQPDSGPAESTT